MLVFFAMQYAFPPVQPSSFFSTTEVAGAEETDLVALFIPSNIFASLAEGLMPAIVLFCFLLGWALIGDARNRPFVDLLKSLESALSKITRLLMAIVPLGVFAITATTFGTLTLPQLLQIQVYYVSAVVLCLVTALLILPLLVYSLTPWTYREILSASHRGVLMGFATARVFITLPLLSEGVASLFRSPAAGRGEPGPGAEAAPAGDGTEPAASRPGPLRSGRRRTAASWSRSRTASRRSGSSSSCSSSSSRPGTTTTSSPCRSRPSSPSWACPASSARPRSPCRSSSR